MILDRFVKDSFSNIQKYIKEDGYSFREAEKKVIGIDHAELGAYIVKQWGFSPLMIRIIKNHHINERGKTDLETSIIYLSDYVCMVMGIGVGDDGLAYRFHEEVMETLDITPSDLERMIAGFGEKLEKIETLIHPE